MQDLYINHHATRKDMSSSTPTQSVDVLSMDTSNHNGNQEPKINRRNGRNNKWGGNRKDNKNDEKNEDNDGGDKKLKRKVKFPCKICGGYHLTYLFPDIEYSLKYIA